MPATRRPARVLHTSDCHLSTLVDGGAREEAAFSQAIDLAIRLEVDAVLIAGDLFDHARVGDDLLDWTAAQLDRLACPVVLLPGNHDVLDERSVHHRFDVGSRCRHVMFLDDPDGSSIEVPGTDLVVWGKAMPEHAPSFRPLEGVPARPADRWGIVAGHGLVTDERGPFSRSSPIRTDQLAELDWDYVALGHCHEHRVYASGTALAAYSGATAASRAGTAGAIILELSDARGASMEWVEIPI